MKPPVFTGTCTALITPFQSTGAIDYMAFAKQIDRQLEAGIDALCVCGTLQGPGRLRQQRYGSCPLSLPTCGGVRSGCAAAGNTILQ